MNTDEYTAKMIPSNIAKAKLLIESPPSVKIHKSTNIVLTVVLIVRVRVVFNESLMLIPMSLSGYILRL